MDTSVTDQQLSFAAPKYPLDKIYYKPEPGSFFVTQSPSPAVPLPETVTLSHDKEETFFIDMQLSVDGDTWYDSGAEPWYNDGATMRPFKRFFGLWDVTNTTVRLTFAALDASYTIYYRLVGYSKD